jgi:hypothetical protein
MANQAKLNEAIKLIDGASMSVDEWVLKVRNQPGYRYHGNKIYKALRALESSVKTAPRPPAPSIPPVRPAPAINLAPAQNVLFLTSDTSEALQTRTEYKLAATADKAYRDSYPEGWLAAARSSGRLRIWCDCRPSGGTPPQVAQEWAQQLGLAWPDCFIGQGESMQEFDVAYAAGAKVIVGNLGTLRDDQKALIDTGRVLWVNETYYNVQPNMPGANWQNLDGVGSNCVAVYESSTEGADYYSLTKQTIEGKFVKGRDSVYVAGFQPADWAVLK